ncbi:MAG TPA: PDR/VanB family oxidoreductase [Jatrophihabitans sp.]|uniref:PDR/VanB family oxidoreductase n=1 Tax=Jatrophihabitans sp. TaxID=1932789 RepID=UPI002E094C3B|nr:PDR/VanB family oxidoreductase [Jatrophihabitans sp.]
MSTGYRPRATTMRALALVVTAYEKVSGVSGLLRPEPTPIDRSLRTRVTALDRLTDDVVSLRLELLDGGRLPRWHPGAHVDVELPSGALRQYSLCGDPDERDHYRIAVRRIADGGGGSRAIHALGVGDRLTLRGPRNAFPFITADRYLFVAGGIGITPIRPMLHDAIRRGAEWQFVYTGRSRASMPFLDELSALDPHRVHVRPDDEYGPPDAAKVLALAPDGAALYTCGPPPMIDAIRAELPAAPIASLHFERFSPAPVVGGKPFEVVLARSGHVVPVGASETALIAIRRVLPDVAYSCQQGFCGTCPVRLLGGDVEHRDRCLTTLERESRVAVCVSRATGRITLDL